MFEELISELIGLHPSIEKIVIRVDRTPTWRFGHLVMVSSCGDSYCEHLIDRERDDVEDIIRDVASEHAKAISKKMAEVN